MNDKFLVSEAHWSSIGKVGIGILIGYVLAGIVHPPYTNDTQQAETGGFTTEDPPESKVTHKSTTVNPAPATGHLTKTTEDPPDDAEIANQKGKSPPDTVSNPDTGSLNHKTLPPVSTTEPKKN